jgi:hypothetical protein
MNRLSKWVIYSSLSLFLHPTPAPFASPAALVSLHNAAILSIAVTPRPFPL